MSGIKDMYGKCDRCKQRVLLCHCPRPANEPYSGSPLESVVHGRPDSPAPSTPDRSGDAILAELRARAMEARTRARYETREYIKLGDVFMTANRWSRSETLSEVISWLDELSQTKQDNTD
jgi:hypothetical protein